MSKAEKERVRDEIMLIQKLKHPRIIHFIKAWHNREREEVVFITEIMTGGSLKQYLKRIKNLHLRVIKQWCRSILEGLQYLHSQKPYPIIHRDLKCENIFVCSSTGNIRIGDLGLSTFMKNSHNKSILGTPQYMAPELYDEHYGPGVDIYSFGLCILEMCTRMTPYSECKTPIEVYNKVTSGAKPQALDRILDLDVKNFIELCLSPVDQRPHAEELLKHNFLTIDETQDKVHLPVMIKVEEDLSQSVAKIEKGQITPTIMEVSSKKTVKDEKEIKVELKIGFRDNVNKKTFPTKVEFVYNTSTDTPERVSEEIIAKFNVDPKYSLILSQLIREKINEPHKEDENEAKVKHKVQSIDIDDIKEIDAHDQQIPQFKEALFKNNSDNPRIEVMLLQRALTHITGDKLLIDGIFNVRTENTVKKFQESLGHHVDGVVKKNLWDVIMIIDMQKIKQSNGVRNSRCRRLNTLPSVRKSEENLNR